MNLPKIAQLFFNTHAMLFSSILLRCCLYLKCRTLLKGKKGKKKKTC